MALYVSIGALSGRPETWLLAGLIDIDSARSHILKHVADGVSGIRDPSL